MTISDLQTDKNNRYDTRISVAPMMDWTDRHCRYFHRLISPHALLYTEMVTTGALIHGDQERHLRYNNEEHPVALQVGGSDPDDLAYSAELAEKYGYDEINLNCGCPSDRVQKGKIGACLMAEPELVAQGIAKMRAATKIPVTVKCRIAIDEYEEEPFLDRFVSMIAETGCDTFIVHARKAWLNGLSPKENRDVPPLRYDIVANLKARYPQLNIMLNGGITTMTQVKDALDIFDGVMIGREAYQNPYFLAAIESEIFKNAAPRSRAQVAMDMIPYMQDQNEKYDTPIKSVARHMIGLFQGQAGAKKWRRYLSENARHSDDAEKLITEALAALPASALEQPAQSEAA